ncbi:MAG: ATP-binding cassette domain-containing protein [Clostridia bacterium]|nr:ATP-binding cassette domain-containing protein [Clostridia bacterium]
MKLEFSDISKSYGKNLALDGFTVSLESGIYALLGPNGSGKTTLMNIITDNLKPDRGTLFYGEGASSLRDARKMGKDFRRRIGYMPQYPAMYATFSVSEFLWYMATLKNMESTLPRKERQRVISERIASLLEAVDLSESKDSRISTLSGGMKQRVGLAQALLGDPEIIILDEPTAGLDPKQRIAIRNLIASAALNKIVILATHVVSDVEHIAKKAIVLKKGRIIGFDTPAALASRVEGKVWHLYCTEDEIPRYRQSCSVINIVQDESAGKVLLRVLSEEKPREDAIRVTPTIEDYYLYTFGSEDADERKD